MPIFKKFPNNCCSFVLRSTSKFIVSSGKFPRLFYSSTRLDVCLSLCFSLSFFSPRGVRRHDGGAQATRRTDQDGNVSGASLHISRPRDHAKPHENRGREHDQGNEWYVMREKKKELDNQGGKGMWMGALMIAYRSAWVGLGRTSVFMHARTVISRSICT